MMLNGRQDVWIIDGEMEEGAPGLETKQRCGFCTGQLAVRLYYEWWHGGKIPLA